MAWAAKASRNASRFSARSASPAAARCPPKLSRCSEQASRAASRSKPGMLRPLPRPPPSPSSETTTTGRWWRSTSREATIPTTPGCQSSPASTSPGASRSASGSSRRAASAAVSTSRSRARRSELARPSSTAISSARASSSVSISSTPASARYRRPAALILGASRNARSPSSNCVGSHFDAADQRPQPRLAASAASPPARASPATGSRRPAEPRQRPSPAPRDQGPSLGCRPGSSSQCTGELPRHRGPAQRDERVVTDFGMQDRAVRQLVAGLVVIGDDRLDPQLARQLHLVDRRHPAVDGDQQLRAPLRQLLDVRRAEPVAVADPVGDQPVALGARARAGSRP